MNKTAISWCDYTWNPITGCSHISEGCDNCYAAAIARRFHKPWGYPVFMPERLHQPSKEKRPSRIFVCSVSDYGHEKVMFDWRDQINEVMEKAFWHTFIVLTKRPGAWLLRLPSNVWCGVTVENQKQMKRWDVLRILSRSDAVCFASVEPMLGPVSFPTDNQPDWVIAGPETGPGARPCKDEWIDQLAAKSRCFHDKRTPIDGTRREFPQTKEKG